MSPEGKQRLTVIGSILLIAGACSWIYFTQINETKYNVGLHQRVGEVMAEQTAGLIGKKGKVVVISIDTREWPELKTQIQAFKAGLNRLGTYELREHELDTKDQPKYGVGSGLSGRRYVRTVKKNETADVFVSFIGAPRMSDEEMAELDKKPKLIAETRSYDNLGKLFESNLISVAVAARFQFPSPGPEKATTPDEWFTKRYQIVTPETAKSLPKEESK
jgi:hypothetical protein